MFVAKEETNSYFLFPELVILLRVRGSHIEYRHESKPVAVKLAVHHFCIVGINTVLKAFPWKKGDEILATTHTYCSIQNACRKAAEFSTGVKYVESVKCQWFLLCVLVRIKKIHMFLSILFLYEIVELYIFVFASCIKSGGHIRQFEINFPIKDEEEIVRNMMSALDEHPNIRIAVLGIFSVFEIMPFTQGIY